jgi:hypothetical protein
MATLAEIGQLVNSGVGVDLGTGSKGSEAILKATTSIWFTKKDFVFDKTVTFDKAYIQQLQAERKLIVLDGVKEFTPNPEENVTETDPDGTISVTRKGLYSFSAMFKKGFAYQAALASLDSFGAYDTLFVDTDGNILGTVSSGDSLKGISTGMVNSDASQFATFSTSMKQGLTFQFTDRGEIDSDYYFVSNKEITFKPQAIDGINEVKLAITVPSDGATTIVFTGKLKQGNGVFTGLVLANLLVKVGGSTITPSNIAEVTGTYTLTVAALSTNDVITIALYDTANTREGVILDGDVYKSATATATTIA